MTIRNTHRTVALPSAILLDLDDTIVAFDVVADDCWREMCTRYAPEAGIAVDALFGAISHSRDWFWSDPERHRSGRHDPRTARRQIVRRAFSALDLGDEHLAVRLADDFTEARVHREHLVVPFPGAVEALHALKQRGVQLALITNGEARSQRAKIERFDLARHFDYILIEGEFGTGKPDPAVFVHALGVLRHRPQDAWMIGNSLIFDIAPARRLGIFSVWIDHRRAGLPTDAPCEPDRTITALREIISND